jgi:hypothetical protein
MKANKEICLKKGRRKEKGTRRVSIPKGKHFIFFGGGVGEGEEV